jgi:capsular polysaccharide transport system ATP-binding protein
MIVLDNVSKGYRTALGVKRILTDVNCELSTDLSLGILGRNGSGKSTLMRMLAGSELPDRGHIDRDVRVSFPVGHSVGFSNTMTGRENIAFLARVYGADVHRTVAFVDDFAELGDYLDETLRTYSNGMRARLAFSACMAIPFDVYLVDEVTAAGDIEFKRRCNQLFAERRRHARIIMASNNAKMLRLYCDRGAILEGGSLLTFDTVEEAVRVYADEIYRTEVQGADEGAGQDADRWAEREAELS